MNNTRTLLMVQNQDSFVISHRFEILLEAKRRGYEVHVAAKDTGLAQVFENNGLRFHPLKISRKSLNPLSNFKTFLHLLFLFWKVKPDLLHLVTVKVVIFGGIASRLAGINRVVTSISGLGYTSTDAVSIKRKCLRYFVFKLYKLALNHKNLIVIFQNEDDLSEISETINLSPEKIVLIRSSGIDLKKFNGSNLSTERPIVMMAARLLKDKGVYEFVEAAKNLKKQNINARFVLVGSPDFDNPTSVSIAEIEQWVKSEFIEYWGYSEKMEATISKALIVVLPSYREGFPKVLLEAAACERAVITTDVPGCRDAMLDGLTGKLVPVKNVEALSTAIKQMVDAPETTIKMGKAGRKFAKANFNIDEIVERHFEIYSA